MRGITLVDLVSLAAAAAVAAAVVGPQRRVRAVISNENQVIEDLRDLDQRLRAHQKAGRLDADGDGVGEYAPLGDVLASRASAAVRVGDAGIYELDGYRFAVMVPGGLRRAPVLAGSPDVVTDGAEVCYAIVAWPARPGETGMRAYIASPQGILRHQIDAYPYGLHADIPPAPEWPMVVYDGDRLRANVYDGDDWKSPVRLPGR